MEQSCILKYIKRVASFVSGIHPGQKSHMKLLTLDYLEYQLEQMSTVIVADLLTAEVFTPLFICSYILKPFQECRGSLMQKSEEQTLLTKPEITWERTTISPKDISFLTFHTWKI